MQFNPSSDIPLLENKVILVTGGTDGLGKESVRQLSLHSPAHIYLAGRNRSKAEKVLEEFKQEHPDHAPITFLELNLSSLASVRAAAKEFLANNDRLDILMCNAGYMGPSRTTNDGYELSFGANHLGHALLIQLLLPILQDTAAEPNSDVRVVSLSSLGEKWAPKHYTFKNMKSDLAKLGMLASYGQSKLANIHYATLLAKRYPEITFVSVHPGQIKTNISATVFEGKPVMEFLCNHVLKYFTTCHPVEEGVKGQLWCAVGKKDDIKNGEFYWPVALLGKGTSKTKDMKMAQGLWDYTEEQIRPYM